MIKSYTDIEQSKKLADILPLESADMYYSHEFVNSAGDYYKPNFAVEGYFDDEELLGSDIPCWSLAALFNVLPVIIGDVLSKNALRLRIDKSETDFNVWYENLDSRMAKEGFDIIKNNSVDACYEMIIKLHELKML